MKETTLSLCEKKFILRACLEHKRLDGRRFEDFRILEVHFGKDWGSCFAATGETKVLAQVSCEVQQPKTTRPNEGFLIINVELSQMAAAHFEGSRGSDLSVHLNRLIEKCIKDSKAVDLESLCIVSEEKVWCLRVDVNILNHDGNLVDCASIAALAAIAHFRRPDVTTDGQEIKIHDISERDPIPITLHHYPVCVSYALLNNGESILADPTAIEERVADASLVFGVNAYGELCGMHLSGMALAQPRIIMSTSSKAAKRAKEVVTSIKESLNQDSQARKSEMEVGFASTLEFSKLTAMCRDRLQIQLKKFSLSSIDDKMDDDIAATAQSEKDEEEDVEEEEEVTIVKLDENSAELIPPAPMLNKKQKHFQGVFSKEDIGEGGPSKWEMTNNQDTIMVDNDDVIVIPTPTKQTIADIELSGDSEEEAVHILHAEDMNEVQVLPVQTPVNKKPKKKSKGKFKRGSARH